ncbi:hypothetical protein E3O19_05845 [Cryobacterium algoritolerans]|uniref:Exo-alpha-sialidase n=1 Tax=Cryobacterium algoritolerans TaxID=1259184 RepID=A0A4R8WXV6_9MICO|nr:hypothetical protein [Cryobacterium algoritolerans]TFC17643.1 hypothetical protein E3O19_05845 [Cryobacterium algoritolerans]
MISPRRTRQLGCAGALATGVAILLAGCAPGPDAAPAAPPAAADGFEHIHGLGADAGSGKTFVATHQGVWLIPTDALPSSYPARSSVGGISQPTRVANRRLDVMGFTVAAPGLLLASGHPAPDQPSDLALPNLGLISSTDAAENWTRLSLAGKTDFHDLDAVPLPGDNLRVYGYDSGTGTLVISDDSGATWSTGETVPLRDLAANPANPDQVFATTAEGLVGSSDAGRTFSLEPDAPTLLLIDVGDAQTGGGLVGIDPAGVVWHQGSAAGPWVKGGRTEGAPIALSYVGGSVPWILAADNRGVVASDDFGATWTVLVSVKA